MAIPITYFHEQYAAKVCNTTLEKMFSKTRKPEVVLARNLCMYFVDEMNMLSQERNANRFDMSHCSVISSKKKMNDLMGTEPALKVLFDKYMTVCKNEKRETENDRLGVNTIIHQGMATFLAEEKAVFIKLLHMLGEFGEGDASDEEVLAEVCKVEASIEKIRYNFTK